MTLRDRIPKLLAPLVAYKIALLLFVVAVPVLLPRLFSVGNYAANFHGQADAPPVLEKHFSTWDGEHFLYLAEHGYTPGAESNRCFPLWPWLIRAGAVLTGGHFLVAALLLSNLFSILAVLLLHRLVREAYDEATADRTVFLWLAFPGALFLLFPYAESLFCLLCIAWWWSVRRRAPLWAALCAGLLPLVRIVGVLIAAPVLIDVAQRVYRDRRIAWCDLVHLLSPAIGFAVYLVIMTIAVGDPWQGVKLYSQNEVMSAHAGRMLDPVGFFRAFANGTDLHAPFTSIIDRIWFVWLIPMLMLLWKRDRVEWAYALSLGLVPAVNNAFWGYTRYFLPLAPVFLTAAVALRAPERRYWYALLLAVFFGLQIVFLARHTSFHWVA